MKIFCIGRNYAEHAKELSNAVPTSPIVFMKPPTALLQDHQPFYYPEFSKDVHYEVELVLRERVTPAEWTGAAAHWLRSVTRRTATSPRRWPVSRL